MTLLADDRPPRTAWQTRYTPRRQKRDLERGCRIAAAWIAEQSAARAAMPRAPFDEIAAARITAAAVARISPAETAAALGWTLGELLAAEERIGLRITVTIEVRP